jgi:FimV-like protein
MESEDAIPIKLDLARAYLEMNDFAAVELALRSVLQQGSEEQREEAKLLLEQAKLAQLEV